MKKRVIIIHGHGAGPESNWFPWLKVELEKRGFEIFVPQMPHPLFPKLDPWLLKLKEMVGKPDENTFLVGHSLGVVTILRYLESLKEEEKVGGIVSVAGFCDGLLPKTVFKTFFNYPFNYKKIKNSANKIVTINSDNDYYIPVKNAKELSNNLNSEMVILNKAFHINQGFGFRKVPIILEKLLEIAK